MTALSRKRTKCPRKSFGAQLDPNVLDLEGATPSRKSSGLFLSGLESRPHTSISSTLDPPSFFTSCQNKPGAVEIETITPSDHAARSPYPLVSVEEFTSRKVFEMDPSHPSRPNEYFIPGDGIEREVITPDIHRYLGPEAVARPGSWEFADGGSSPGYSCVAHRSLASVSDI
ncbi:hypothetical protein QBC47DRAFT_372758 [Echria macrotheca]|uniref:Uncharacterized protein n=1 Tax=Echria macrotheca TaxID=438768 RepID=A0AAJ0FFB3_9PEZI|nr:hypothetical protein QBC47DRAFT_372758 [Echria macrotheca]